jgi:uncharacterized protein DUF2434
MSVPRSWSKITDQGGIAQQMAVAKPAATDGRFKACAIFLGIAYLIVWYCVRHNLHYYRPHRRNPLSFFTLLVRSFPPHLTLALVVVGVYIGYIAASAWLFNISIIKYDVAVVWPFALGYTPCILLLIIFNVAGYLEPNEDKALIQQRVERGRAADAEIGITKKPSWWSKARGDHHLDDLQRLRGMVADTNINSNEAADDNRVSGEAVEMANLPASRDARSTANAFDTPSTLRSRSESRNRLTMTESRGILLPPRRSDRLARTPSNNSMASALTGNTLGTEPKQQTIRSMLDV